MRTLRRDIRLKDGVIVKVLITPHLFSFKGYKGLTFEATTHESMMGIFEQYADILYAGALNAWVLDEGRDPDEFPCTRGDFHEYMTLEQKAFGADLEFAVLALTGKTLTEILKAQEGVKEDPSSKKKATPSTGWLSRLFSSGRAASVNTKQR